MAWQIILTVVLLCYKRSSFLRRPQTQKIPVIEAADSDAEQRGMA